MLAAQTAMAMGGSGIKRRRGRALGFSAFGDYAAVVGGSGSVDVAALQRALNAIRVTELPLLVVDGNLGSKTRARIAEFKRLYGYSPVNSEIDSALIVALGLGSSAVQAGVGVGAGATLTVGNAGPGYFDINDRWVSTGQVAGADIGTDVLNPQVQSTGGEELLYALSLGLFGKRPQALTDNIERASDAALAAARETVKTTGEAAQAALKLLADNGDWIAKAALALGVSYAVATAITIGGAGVVLIVLLKSRK